MAADNVLPMQTKHSKQSIACQLCISLWRAMYPHAGRALWKEIVVIALCALEEDVEKCWSSARRIELQWEFEVGGMH